MFETGFYFLPFPVDLGAQLPSLQAFLITEKIPHPKNFDPEDGEERSTRSLVSTYKSARCHKV
jgi:hypothetical protein